MDKLRDVNKEIFLGKVKEKFGDYFCLDEVEYVNNKTKVTIICPIHGRFDIRPNAFLASKHGCPKCGSRNGGVERGNNNRKSLEEFIEEAKAVHGDKYDYSKVEYINNSTKVCIICPEHGEFWQTPSNHLSGNGCKECSKELKRRLMTKSFEEFENEAKSIHGSKYKYDSSTYKNSLTKMRMICPKHGEFWQEPNSHLKGHGCPYCANKFKTKEDFIKAANLLYGGKYSYDKVEYNGARDKVCITCPKHGDFWQEPHNHLQGHGCPRCVVPISKWESEVFEYVMSLGLDVEQSNRELLEGKEIDIYVPSKRIGIECDGIRWHDERHKDKYFHLKKTNECLENGIRLIHIFEDEWVYKRKIVMSMLMNAFGMTSNKVYARKCEVREISGEAKRDFLNENHIQGDTVSSINVGLYHDGELVSVMTFGNPRLNVGGRTSDGKYELVRFCNKLNTSVIGGASKLFKWFLLKYNPNEVISYSDKRWSMGKLYGVLKFEHIHDSKPNYSYVVGTKRENRFKYRKDRLVEEGYDKEKSEHEIMLERKIYRIYDCGCKCYLYEK